MTFFFESPLPCSIFLWDNKVKKCWKDLKRWDFESVFGVFFLWGFPNRWILEKKLHLEIHWNLLLLGKVLKGGIFNLFFGVLFWWGSSNRWILEKKIYILWLNESWKMYWKVRLRIFFWFFLFVVFFFTGEFLKKKTYILHFQFVYLVLFDTRFKKKKKL